MRAIRDPSEGGEWLVRSLTIRLIMGHFHPLQEWVPYNLSYDSMPGFLYPRVGYALQPPVYHCGWVVEDAWILDYAKKHGVLQIIVPLDDGYDSGEDEEDAEEDILDDEGNRVSLGLTTENVCREVQRRAGIDATATMRLRGELVYEKDMEEARTCFSICTNYNKAYRLSLKAPDMRKIKKELERPDDPRWYLDLTESEWEPDRVPT